MVDFNYMYANYYAYVRAICARMVYSEADYITNMAFYKLSKCTYATQEEVAKEFLRTTSVRLCIDYLRKQKRERDKINHMKEELNLISEPSNEEDVNEYESLAELSEINASVLDFIYKEIKKLPPATRSVFELYYFKSMDARQIASAKGVSYQTIQNLLHYAREKLRMKILFKKEAAHIVSQLPHDALPTNIKPKLNWIKK